jgi:hypothetical protein
MASELPKGTVVLDSTLRGIVAFTPSFDLFRVVGTDGEPDLIDVEAKVARLAGGYVAVQLEDFTGATPTPAYWTAHFNVETDVDDVRFQVTAGATVNLADLVSLVTGPGIVVVVSDEDRRRAEAAAAYVATALASHIAATEPHPAYDDMPDLASFYANRKAVQ